MPLERWHEEFAQAVSRGTGLELDVVRGWVFAEGGPPENPLNIGPGNRYANVQAAAQATIRLLHSSTYAPVLRAAREGGVKEQIAAIASSPWDACHYRGTVRGHCADRLPGTLLAGAVVRARKEEAAGESLGESAREAAAGAVGPLTDWVERILTFVKEQAVLALAYVALTFAAGALFVLGLMRTAGTSPSELAGAVGARRGGGGIPY